MEKIVGSGIKTETKFNSSRNDFLVIIDMDQKAYTKSIW